ncbi:hypothetical protein EDD34_3210 [Myceligenerans xiligouense]|uniref:Uncharacterized protein n=2 Tax=Myceligenerans xiligouense TaxID=253184 RepID=A0A3N4YT42_9MICO|nr:hypothetical protein EDD34_3210 [Myceligenerans xiligouense]
MSAWWLRRYGRAEMAVDIGPSEVKPVYYAPPHHMWGRGAMGAKPQNRHGLLTLTAFIATFLVAVTVTLFVILPAIVFLPVVGP